MDRIVAFIGPSMVGKTTVAKRLSLLTREKVISTDSLCLNHTYHIDDPEESIELFDDLKEYIDSNGTKIVDIGANTIEMCGKRELDYLQKVLTINDKKPVFYLLLPSSDYNKSFDFLSKTSKKIYGTNPDIISSLSASLLSPVYSMLNPNIIITLKDYKKTLCSGRNTYTKHLEWTVTDKVFNDLLFDKLNDDVKPTN
jgi:adenylate kinase family enzyme